MNALTPHVPNTPVCLYCGLVCGVRGVFPLRARPGSARARGPFPSEALPLFILPQLVQLRGRDRTFTLLHALVEQLMLHQPGLLTLIQELAEFESVPGGKRDQDFDQTERNLTVFFAEFRRRLV